MIYKDIGNLCIMKKKKWNFMQLCKKRLVKNKLSATIHNMKRERIGVYSERTDQEI